MECSEKFIRAYQDLVKRNLGRTVTREQAEKELRDLAALIQLTMEGRMVLYYD